jgi:hypothetical protein
MEIQDRGYREKFDELNISREKGRDSDCGVDVLNVEDRALALKKEDHH